MSQLIRSIHPLAAMSCPDCFVPHGLYIEHVCAPVVNSKGERPFAWSPIGVLVMTKLLALASVCACRIEYQRSSRTTIISITSDNCVLHSGMSTAAAAFSVHSMRSRAGTNF